MSSVWSLTEEGRRKSEGRPLQILDAVPPGLPASCLRTGDVLTAQGVTAASHVYHPGLWLLQTPSLSASHFAPNPNKSTTNLQKHKLRKPPFFINYLLLGIFVITTKNG